jgi:AraC-like DNA-binding protein
MVTDRFTLTSSEIGFSMLSRTTLSDDMVCIAYMRRTTPGSLWCEMSLEPGAVIAYARAAEHTARNLAGTRFIFVITDQVQYEEHADLLGIRFGPPPLGDVQLLARTAKTDLVGRTFETCADYAATGRVPPPPLADAVMRAATHALSDDRRARRIGRVRAVDKRRVVINCIDYATSIHRIPSIRELCLVAHVSERTLREAFVREYDLPPSQYFRLWALEEAHRQLIRNQQNPGTVTEIATGLGFDHLGRFAGRYKQLYGETPSETLHAAN